MTFDLEKARATYSAGCAEDAANLVPDLIARIQELEDALAEYQRLGKIMEGRLPCLTLHGECERCSSRAKEVCDAMHQIAEGKIGPDAALKKQWDEVLAEGKISSSDHGGEANKLIGLNADHPYPAEAPRSWQITDERKAAMQHILMCHHCRYDDSSCKASEVLRAMLKEVEG